MEECSISSVLYTTVLGMAVVAATYYTNRYVNNRRVKKLMTEIDAYRRKHPKIKIAGYPVKDVKSLQIIKTLIDHDYFTEERQGIVKTPKIEAPLRQSVITISYRALESILKDKSRDSEALDIIRNRTLEFEPVEDFEMENIATYISSDIARFSLFYNTCRSESRVDLIDALRTTKMYEEYIEKAPSELFALNALSKDYRLTYDELAENLETCFDTIVSVVARRENIAGAPDKFVQSALKLEPTKLARLKNAATARNNTLLIMKLA